MLSDTIKMAEEAQDFVVGVVCQSKGLLQSPGLIQLTPGVKICGGGDGLGQQYVTPHSAIVDKGADLVVVGRGIYGAADPAAEAKIYQEQLWAAYQERIQSSS